MRSISHLALALLVTWTSFFVAPPAANASWANIVAKLGKGARLSFAKIRPNKTTGETGGTLVRVHDESGKVVNSTLLESASKETLQQLSPNKIKELAAASASKGQRPGMKAIVGSTIMRFPMESFSFFLAIGAVTTAQLMFDYSNNPVAMQQHLEAQKDPVGHLGFLAFMIANGVVSEPLMAAMESSRLRHFVPYLGMSVGMMASNIVHEVGHFPHLMQCAKESMGFKPKGSDGTACEKAYQAWIEYEVGNTLHEWAPGLISMLASTVISGALTMGIQWTAGQVLRVTAIEIATFFAPGGIFVKGARFVLKIGQFALFVGVDQLIHHHIYGPYQNFVQSIDLSGRESQMLSQLIKSKRNGFQSGLKEECWSAKRYQRAECGQDLLLTLMTLQEDLYKWRQFNMQDVLLSHSNWSQFLTQLSQQYRSAKSFYRHFMSEIWQKEHGRFKDYTRVIDRTFPLNGIKADGLNPEAINAFLDDPEAIEEMQLITVQKTHNQFTQLANSKHVLFSSLSPEYRARIDEILTAFKSAEPQKIGQAIDKLNDLAGVPVKKYRVSEPLLALAQQIRNSLGQPRPLWEAGVGYLKYYAIHPSYRFENPVPFTKSLGMLATPTVEESHVAAMFAGPDADKVQSLIKNTSGFKANFLSPRIIKDDNAILVPNFVSTAALGMGGAPIAAAPIESVFTSPIQVTRGGQRLSFKGIYDYIKRGNIKSEVLTSDPTSFRTWWEKYPETSYVEAWIDYEQKYQDIIVKLLKKIWNEDGDSTLNMGGISNSLALSMEQERKVYLLILGELFKQAYQNTYKTTNIDGQLLSKRYNSQAIPKYLKPKIYQMPGVQMAQTVYLAPNLMESLRSSNSLSLQNLYSHYPNSDIAKSIPADSGVNLRFQDLVLNDFKKIEALLKQLKVVKARHKSTQEAKEITLSTVNNQQFKEAKINLDQSLDLIGAIMGVDSMQVDDDSGKSAPSSMVQLSDYQKALAQFLLQALKKQSEELINLGQIANSVSYREQHGESEFANLRCFAPGTQQSSALSRLTRYQDSCEPYSKAP